MLRVELGKELVTPIWNGRREVSPILPLERKQGWRVIEAEQLKVWRRKVEVRCRFQPASLVFRRFHVGEFPAHGLPTEKGTFIGLWRVSFVHVLLPLLTDELR